MIITFGTQKGGVGKTTLAIAFANYLSIFCNKKVEVFDLDFQRSFLKKWEEDNDLLEDSPKLYEVHYIDDVETWATEDNLERMKADTETFYICDLAGTLDASYMTLLGLSDFMIIPFEYSNVSARSTMIFINFLAQIDSPVTRIFIRNRYDKGYDYKNQVDMDETLDRLGYLIKEPIYKRNELQYINTRKLNYRQKQALDKPFQEVIDIIKSA